MRNLNWNAVYGFWLVAKHGSFAEAARCLPLNSVQALHKRVRQLETPRNLDLKLLRSRGVKGVELTEAGRRLHAVLDPVFASFDKLVTELRGDDSGYLLLAMPPDTAHNYAPALLRRFHNAYPKVTVRLLIRNVSDVIALAEMGQVDFGICVAPPRPRLLAVAGRVPLIYKIVVSRKHRLSRGPLTWERIVEEPLVLLERSTFIRQAFEDLIRRRNLSERIVVAAEVTVAELAVDIVRAGFGVALVPIGTRSAGSLQGVLALSPPPGLPRIDLGVVYRKDRYLSKYMKAFIEMATLEVGNLAPLQIEAEPTRGRLGRRPTPFVVLAEADG